MNVKPSLAFRRDNPSRERAICARLDRQATRLLALAGGAKSPKATEALRNIARDLQAVAGEYHPREQRFATVNDSGTRVIALIDSRTSENYRLLPCSEAGAFSIESAKSVSRWRVTEWPSLALAVEHTQGFNRIRLKMQAEDRAHRKRMAPFERQLNAFQSRMTRKAIAARRKEVASTPTHGATA